MWNLCEKYNTAIECIHAQNVENLGEFGKKHMTGLLDGGFTWNTLGALTRLASADDSVAANTPARTRGAQPDIKLATYKEKQKVIVKLFQNQLATCMAEARSISSTFLNGAVRPFHGKTA